MSDYKTERYAVVTHHKAVVDKKNPWNNMPAYDTSMMIYRIISTINGEVLDDAQGYGYKTAQKAYAAYAYKTRDKSKNAEKEKRKWYIRTWLKKHKSFVKLMDGIAFEIAKGSWGPNDKFDSKLVAKLLKENNLEPDFTAGELLKVWSNY